MCSHVYGNENGKREKVRVSEKDGREKERRGAGDRQTHRERERVKVRVSEKEERGGKRGGEGEGERSR